MPTSTQTSPMPKAQLSPDDTKELRELSAVLERELITAYEKFVHHDKRQVDQRQWKHDRSQEDLHVYVEQRAWKQQERPSSYRSQTKSDVEISPHAAMAASSSMPRIMAVGTSPGTLDDALYGASFHNTATLRARNAYEKSNIEDTAILSTIEGPTYDDPYRFIGLVWHYKVFPIPAIMNSREFLLLMANYTTQLNNGERVGVAMYHSVQHRDVPKSFDGSMLRADFSLLVLRRQFDERRVEFFMLKFKEPHGSMPRALVLQETTRTLLSVTNACDVAFRRKLLFCVRHAERQRKSNSNREHRKEAKRCAQCDKSFGIFSGSGCMCRICGKRVCSKCSSTRNIFLDDSDTTVITKPFDFCTVCAVKIKDVASVDIAREELRARSIVYPDTYDTTGSAISTRHPSIASS